MGDIDISGHCRQFHAVGLRRGDLCVGRRRRRQKGLQFSRRHHIVPSDDYNRGGVPVRGRDDFPDIGQLLSTLLLQLGEGVTSGHHLLIDLLLIAAGVLMIIQALRHLRSGSKAAQTTQSSDSKALSVGVIGMLGLGLMMTATNVNQWVFTTAAVNELIRMDITPWGRLLAFLLFLMLSSVMIVLPLVLVFARPQNVKGDLEKVNGWINGSMRTIAVGILVLIGLFLIAKGGTGVLNSMSG